MRLYVTGALAVERASLVVDESQFPSRQARLLFACLACERSRAVPKDELAEILWPDEMPSAWDTALKALVSKLRHVLAPVMADASEPLLIASQFGCYQLRLPSSSWVDWEAARRALDEAEGAIRSGKLREGWGPANVAVIVARRGFLPGEHGLWVEARRRSLAELLARALDCYGTISLESGQSELAAQVAEEAIAREPFRESGYQHLMRAHERLGNRAEAVRAYHRCRALLGEELGVSPSPETEALYVSILKRETSADD